MATQTPVVDIPQNFPQTAEDVGAVPTTTTVNGHALSGNVTVTASDLGAEVTANKGAASGYMGLGADGYAVPAQLGPGSQLAGDRVAPASPSAAGTQSAAHFSAVAALKSMSTQAANAVAITGGTATGLTQLATTAACTALLGGAAASAQSSLAILASKTIAVPAAISVWRGLDFQASTLTLTAGGVAPNELSAAYFAAPTITQTDGVPYVLPIVATVTIAGRPVARADGGGTPTLSSAMNLRLIGVNDGIGVFIADIGSGFGLHIPDVVAPGRGIQAYHSTGTAIRAEGNDGVGIFAIQYGAGTAISANVLFGGTGTALSVLGGDNGIAIASSGYVNVTCPVSIASVAGAVWNGIKFAADTLTITGGPGAITSLCKFLVEGPTITSAAANVTTDFYTQRIGVATFVGVGPASATRNWSLYVEGNTRFGGAQTIPGKQILIGASPYTVLETDYFLEVQSNGGAITINLPALTGGTQLNGRIIIIKDSGYNAAAANITVVRGNAGDKINNVAGSYAINGSGNALALKANTTNNDWEIW